MPPTTIEQSIWPRGRLALLAVLFSAGCGGRIAGDALEGSGAPHGAVPYPSSPSAGPDASAPSPSSPVRLASIDHGDYLGLLAFDAANVYAAIFSSISSDGDLCGWKSRWLRIAKDGSSTADLGDAATCELQLNRTAVVLGGSLYWLGERGTQVSTLMTMPTSGGAATSLRGYSSIVDGFGTDGTDLFAVTTGTSADYYGDGAVLRLAPDGTPTTLVDKQVGARWVGITEGYVVWSVTTDCSFENTDCQSTTFYRMPTGGGAAEVIAKRPGGIYPTQASGGAIFYLGGSGIERVGLDGAVSVFATTPWQGGDGFFTGLVELRVVGDEAIGSADVGSDEYLLAVPRAFDPPFVDFPVFDVDEGLVYGQRDGGLERFAPP